MKTTSTVGIAVGCFWLGLAGVAQAATINLQLGETQADGVTPGVPVYAGTGAAPDAGTTWNFAGHPYHAGALEICSKSNLLTSTGSATTVSVQVGDATHGVGSLGNGGTTNNLFLNGEANTNSANQPIPIAITGLSPNGTYDLYLYGFRDTGWHNSVTFAGATNGSTQTAIGDSLNPNNATQILGSDQGHSFVYFSAVPANGSGTITGSMIGTVSNRAVINGMQIRFVPEPTALSLLALGSLALLRRRR